MLRSWTALAVVGLVVMGCDGHYRVGAMGEEQALAGAGGSMPSVMPSWGGSDEVDDDGELGSQCVPSGMPEDLGGMLALPEVVWNRLSPVIWGDAAPPPSELPAQSSAEWADEIASQALDQAIAEQGEIPGASAFVRKWLRFPTGTELSREWGKALASETPALHLLLATPLSDTRRIGAFSEQAWLAAYPAISTRGFLMLQALFGQFIPPEPDGLDSDVPTVPGFSRREQLAANVSSPSCAQCHDLIDPLGISLEHFDADGLYRDYDAGRLVDASNSYLLRVSDRMITFNDVGELGSKLENSCDANLGLASEFLRLAVGNHEAAAQVMSPEYKADRARVQQGFIRGGRSYRALVRAYAQSAAVLLP
jgi:hypothetical protein